MDNYSNNIIFQKENKKKLSPRWKFTILLTLILILFLSIPASLMFKKSLYVSPISNDEILELLYLDESITETVKNKSKEFNSANLSYISNYKIKNVANINRTELLINTSLELIYTNAYINSTSNIVLIYKDKKWIIKEIKDIELQDTIPTISAGWTLLDILRTATSNKGVFISNDVNYKFNIDYINKLNVIKEEGDFDSTKVILSTYDGLPDSYMRGTLNFDFDKLEWVLTDFTP